MAFDWMTVIGWLNPGKWIEKCFKYFQKAKLHVYFDSKETYHTAIVVDMGNIPGYFCHVMVRNEGKETAKNCQARLIDIQYQDANGKFIHHPQFVNPVVLKWAHESDFGLKDIEVDLPRRLDLCFVLKSSPDSLRFFAPMVPNGVRTVFPKGIYDARIRIGADNTHSITANFIIDFTKEWNQVFVSNSVKIKKESMHIGYFWIALGVFSGALSLFSLWYGPYLLAKPKESQVSNLPSPQVKIRPYLIPKLISNPPYFVVDGQSVMTFMLMDNKFLYMRFQLNNSEGGPALNLRGKYDSPTQKDVYFDMGENVILPNSFSQRIWVPWINIESIVNEQTAEPFDVTLTIEYDGQNDGDNQRYLSFLKLKLKKTSNNRYMIIDQKVNFGTK